MQRVEPLPSSGYNPRVLRRLQPMGLAVWLGQGALVPGAGGVIGVGLKDEVLTGGKHHGHDTTTVSPRSGAAIGGAARGGTRWQLAQLS